MKKGLISCLLTALLVVNVFSSIPFVNAEENDTNYQTDVTNNTWKDITMKAYLWKENSIIGSQFYDTIFHLIYEKNDKKYAQFVESEDVLYDSIYELKWLENEKVYLPTVRVYHQKLTTSIDPTTLGYSDEAKERQLCIHSQQLEYKLCYMKHSGTIVESEKYAYVMDPKVVSKENEEGETVMVAETHCYVYGLYQYEDAGDNYFVKPAGSGWSDMLYEDFIKQFQPAYNGMTIDDYYKQVVIEETDEKANISFVTDGRSAGGSSYDNGYMYYDKVQGALVMKNVQDEGILHITDWKGTFIIRLEGDNSIGGIVMDGVYDFTLDIDGKGSLSVNEKKTNDTAIHIAGTGYKEKALLVGDKIELKLYANEGGNSIKIDKTTIDAEDKAIVWKLRPEGLTVVKENSDDQLESTYYNYVVKGTQIGSEPPHEHTAAVSWSGDDTNHWKICAECGEKLEETIAAHTVSDWKYEGDYHWKECTVCGRIIGEREKHSFDAGAVTKKATETEAGVMTYTCRCGYTKIETIPKLESTKPSGDSGTGTTDTGGDAAGKDGSGGASSATGDAGKIAVAAGTETKDESGATYTVKAADAETASGTVEVEYTAADTTEKTVTIPSTVTVNGVEATVTTVAASAFEGNKTVTTVTIPSTVEEIGNNAFKGCANLTTVTIPASVEEIGDSAFRNCTKLKKVTIPKNVETVGKNAFAGCSSLTTVDIKSTTITKIDQGAFKNCKKLTEVTVTKNVTTIGKEAFSGDKKLKTITIKSTKLKSVGKNAFKGVPKSTTIKVPKKQKAAYTKLLKKAGFKGKVK